MNQPPQVQRHMHRHHLWIGPLPRAMQRQHLYAQQPELLGQQFNSTKPPD